jgi:hypothetical protein
MPYMPNFILPQLGPSWTLKKKDAKLGEPESGLSFSDAMDCSLVESLTAAARVYVYTSEDHCEC